jgi:N6-adenosine-specific RNA methylase IME4
VCVIVWAKAWMGALGGGAWQSNVEFCLFARRGNLPTHGQARGRWYTWPRKRGAPVREGERRQSGHSAKPEAFLDIVEQVSPGPYLELFARRQRLGWDTWGDEALNHVELAS